MGCVPAATMRTPPASAMLMSERRRCFTASLASGMSWQTGVPTSTTLRCNSGLISSPRWVPAASISSMWLFSSRVWGSMSWNSSSMPRVKRGSITASGGSIARGDEEGRDLAAARRHVGQGGPGEAREEALHLALEDEGVEVHHQVAEAQGRLAVPPRQLREGLALQLYLLLNDVGLPQGLGQGLLPGGVGHLPAEEDALAAVLVVGLHHQLGPVAADERGKVDPLPVAEGVAVA